VDSNGGTLYGGATFTNGVVGQAFRFNGSSGHVRVTDRTNLHFTTGMTAEAWVNPAHIGTEQSIAVKWDAVFGLNQRSFSFSIGADGRAYFGVSPSAGSSVDARTTNTITAGQWTHLAGTYDGTAVRIYVNGTLHTQVAYNQGIFPGTADLGIGGTVGGASPGQLVSPFDGRIDELSLYNRGLSGAEIQAIYLAQSAGKCPLPGAPPSIQIQPQSQTTTIGSNVTFSVVAAGTPPLGYQWRFQGTNVAGPTTSAYSITNVQLANAGNYSVRVSNAFGFAVSSNVVLTVNPGPTLVRVADSSVASGGIVTVPVLLNANGSENALSFSLGFNTSRVSYVSAILASGEPATLFVNESQTTNGRLGFALALPANSTFPAGAQDLIEVSFKAAIVNNDTTTPISIVDQPTIRQVSDVFGNALPASYSGGTLSIAGVVYEADVSPRPGGDKAVTVTDWVLIGRYAPFGFPNQRLRISTSGLRPARYAGRWPYLNHGLGARRSLRFWIGFASAGRRSDRAIAGWPG